MRGDLEFFFFFLKIKEYWVTKKVGRWMGVCAFAPITEG